MTADEASFMDAIIASPRDDAPRLIFADWLEENGQNDRADFIRVQCDLAAIPPFNGVRIVGQYTEEPVTVERDEFGQVLRQKMVVSGEVPMIDLVKHHRQEIGQLGSMQAFWLRFGRFEGRAVVENHDGEANRYRMVPARFLLLPWHEDGKILYYRPHNDRSDSLRKRALQRIRVAQRIRARRNAFANQSEVSGAAEFGC